MNELLKQIWSTAGAAFAAACCAGTSWALAALTALGAGFLINDAVLIPLYVVLLGLSVWLLSRSARSPQSAANLSRWSRSAGRAHRPLDLDGHPVAGLGLIVASSFWDYLGARASRQPADLNRR